MQYRYLKDIRTRGEDIFLPRYKPDIRYILADYHMKRRYVDTKARKYLPIFKQNRIPIKVRGLNIEEVFRNYESHAQKVFGISDIVKLHLANPYGKMVELKKGDYYETWVYPEWYY